MTRALRVRVALCLSLVWAGCAAGRIPPEAREVEPVRTDSSRELAVAGLRAWVVRGDPATAERRLAEALRREGADPWAHMGGALLARRHLDESGEAAHLVAVVVGAPDHPLAPIAGRRLQQLATVAPPLAAAVESGLAPAQQRLSGVTAARVRMARATAATTLGAWERARSLRRDAGAVTAWTLSGPFGALHALELDTPFPPERGVVPASAPGAAGMPAAPSRTMPCPDGTLVIEGEPNGDLFYVATDATAGRGGEYLLSVTTGVSVRLFLDGLPVAERRDHAAFPARTQVVAVSLTAGAHHLLAKIGRGSSRASLAVFLARADGAPSDLTFAATAPGEQVPAVRGGALPRVSGLPGDLAAQLEGEAGPEVARLLAARDVVEEDRESAKVLLADSLQRAPASTAMLAFRAEVARQDPTLVDRVARARAEADLDRALALDPADASAHVARGELAVSGERYDDAAALLDAIPDADAARPRVLVARAKLARARGLSPLAERLAEEARRTGADCAAVELLFGLATRRDAVATQDDVAVALARCPGGAEHLAEHRRRRGDLAGALAALDDLVREAPARIDIHSLHAALLASSGRIEEAARELADLARLWPRDARIEKRRGEVLEMGGDASGAREARERALLLDGGDLSLRRALALEHGREPLDEVAEDGLDAIARYRAAAPAYATSGVTVLDFGAVEAHPGGAYTERIHTVVEARDQRAVDAVGEIAIPEGAELLLARTVKHSGGVLQAEEPVGDKRTLSLPGLEPGDFAEWEWIRTVPARGPGVPGYTADAFFFRADMPLWRSLYVVSAPVEVGLELDAHRMPPVEVRHEADRLVARITRRDVPALLPEPNAPGDAEELPFVQAGAGARTDALARAMADALLDEFRPSAEVLDLAREIRASVPGGSRDEVLVRAAYRRVDALVLGAGAFDEPASWILSRGRGNRTVLLKAVLGALGVKARIALVRDWTRDPAPYRFPRPDRYVYAVLRVEYTGGTVWLDPTLRGTPFGDLPDRVRDMEALVLPEPGEDVLATRTPVSTGREEGRRTTLDVALDGDGNATVDGREEYRGMDAATLRSSLERLDATARRQSVEQILARSFRGGALSSLVIEGEDATEEPLVVRWRARVERWARLEPGRATIDAAPFPARLGTRFLQRASRETQLLVPADERAVLELTVRAPPGWSAVAAAPAEVTSPFGGYRRDERTDGARLVRRDAFELRRHRIAPAEYGAFSAFARSLDSAQQAPMRFDRAAPGAGLAGQP